MFKPLIMTYNQFKRKVFDFLEPKRDDPPIEKFVNTFIVTLIIVNVITVSLETVESIDKKYGFWINLIEDISVFIFVVEYGLRLWTINLKHKFKGKYGRIKYIFTFSALIDLASILPFFMTFLSGMKHLRFLRLLSFIRFFKLGRYSSSFKLMDDVWRKKKDLLTASIFLSVFLIIAASFFMYMAEHSAQPDKFSSIPQSMYWAVITLTSTGYGDIYPITGIGKFMTMIITIVGIGMVALPIAIFSSGFVEEIAKERDLENDRQGRYQKYLEYKLEFEKEEEEKKENS